MRVNKVIKIHTAEKNIWLKPGIVIPAFISMHLFAPALIILFFKEIFESQMKFVFNG